MLCLCKRKVLEGLSELRRLFSDEIGNPEGAVVNEEEKKAHRHQGQQIPRPRTEVIDQGFTGRFCAQVEIVGSQKPIDRRDESGISNCGEEGACYGLEGGPVVEHHGSKNGTDDNQTMGEKVEVKIDVGKTVTELGRQNRNCGAAQRPEVVDFVQHVAAIDEHDAGEDATDIAQMQGQDMPPGLERGDAKKRLEDFAK